MSKRAIHKRRHRHDFNDYMLDRKIDKEAGGPMWKRCGYLTEDAYKKYLATKPKDSQMQLPPQTLPDFNESEHEHGEGCTHHSDDRSGT